MSPFLDKTPCLDAFRDAVKKYGAPDIANTDQGCQFTSDEWIKMVMDSAAKVSMDGKGRWVDNIFIERFWRSLKYEAIFLYSLDTLEQARIVIEEYIEFYNNGRPHQSLGYKTPQFVYMNSQITEQALKKQDETAKISQNDIDSLLQTIDSVMQQTIIQSEVFMSL